MRIQSLIPSLGMISAGLLLVMGTFPALAADGEGPPEGQAAKGERTSLEAKRLSDAEMDQITAGNNLFPPTDAFLTISVRGIDRAGNVLDQNFGDVPMPRAENAQVDFHRGQFTVGLPAQ